MYSLLFTISFSILLYLAWGALYQFVFALAGIFYQNGPKTPLIPSFQGDKKPFIRVFIPAYREDAVILHTAAAALQQHYPAARFEVVVVADGLQAATLATLNASTVRVVEVQFEKSTKAKALNQALRCLDGRSGEPVPDIAVVLDADNVMQPNFLARVAAHFATGTKALQGRRAAKNGQTNLAVLDAASEDVNNHILCRGHRVLGLSARLAGSGMAFDYALFATVMPLVDAVGGFDKELELRLTQQGVCIEYDEKAVIWDEKVSQSQAFSTQRSRWIAAQFRYAKRFLPAGFAQLVRRGNVDFFNKTLQMTLPPRLLSPGLLALGTLATAIFDASWTAAWAAALVLNLAAFALALPSHFYRPRQLRALASLPLAFFSTLRALTGLREANQVFIVTPKMMVTEPIASRPFLPKNG